MKAFLVSALALGTLSSVALAEPVELTDAEMDNVTAAGFVSAGVPPTFRATFGRPLTGPPRVRGFGPFVLPSGAIVVVRDGDIVPVLDSRVRIGFTTPRFFPGFGTTIVIKNVVAPVIAP